MNRWMVICSIGKGYRFFIVESSDCYVAEQIVLDNNDDASWALPLSCSDLLRMAEDLEGEDNLAADYTEEDK